MMRGFSHPSALLSCPRSRTVRKRIGRSPSPHVRMGSFLFSAKYDRSPSPRRERNSVAGNYPLIRARLSNHLTASCAGLFDRPAGAPHLLFSSGKYIQRRGDLPVLHENRVTAARPSPRRERNSVVGNCPLIRARLSNHLTAFRAGLFDRPSGAPQPSPHQRRIQAAPGKLPSSSRKSSDSRIPSPRRERNSVAGNCPLIRARLSNHLTASCAGLFDRPSGAPQPSPHQRRIQTAPGDFPVLHENRVTAAAPLPAAKETPSRGIVRSSAPGFLTAPLARRSLLPISGEYRPRWGDLPLHAGAARIFAFCRAWTRAFCRETLAFPTLIWYINGVFMK